MAATTQVVSVVLVAEREEQASEVVYLGPRAMCQAPGGEEPVPSARGCSVQPVEQGPLSGGNELQQAGEPSSTMEKKRPPVQHPVYFISAMLRDARERYPEIQKLLLGVLIASRKLRHYFEGRRITVGDRVLLGMVAPQP